MRSTKIKTTKKPRGSSVGRQDGTATRQHILEVAGQVFAERGFADATSKEICERAGTNVAAVNYHFGSKDELYYAVLVETHQRLGTLGDVNSLADLRDDPQALIAAYLEWISPALNTQKSWQLQVFLREMLSPSPLRDRMEQREAIPKAKIYKALIADLMQLPADHPAVAIAVINVIAPGMFLLLGHPQVTKALFPDLELTPQELRQYMVPFVTGGLEAVAKQAAAELKAQKTATADAARGPAAKAPRAAGRAAAKRR
jgi:AcrR family transcriptional regulator